MLFCTLRHQTVLFNLQNEMSQKQCAQALEIEGFFSKIEYNVSKYALPTKVNTTKIVNTTQNVFFRNIFGPKIHLILDPISLLIPQTDFIKDIILVVRLFTLTGGMVVFTNPQLFSSTVRNYLHDKSESVIFIY